MTIAILSVLSILVVSVIILGILCIKKIGSLNEQLSPPPAEIDISLENLNTFIRREFLFEFIKWIMPAPTTIDMNGPIKTPSFVNELKNPDILKEKMSLITAQIISKMSIYLIREYNAVYNNSDGTSIYDYVTRQVMFYIRRVDFEITTLFQTEQDTKTADIMKQYVLAIEAEIYKLNNILIVKEEPTTESNVEG